MKKGLRAIRILVSAMALIGCLTGCFDRRELNTLGFVLAVALDRGEEQGETKVTLQFANISDESAKSGMAMSEDKEGGEGPSYINVSESGTDINVIIRGFEHKVSRSVYIPHNQVIVISADLAKEGVRDVLDFFARAQEGRMTLPIMVSKGSAEEVLRIPPIFEKTPASELAEMIKAQRLTSQLPIVSEFEFARILLSKTTSAVLPIVGVIETDGKEATRYIGTAVFKGDKMVGELDYSESRGMLYVQDKVEMGIFRVELSGASASVEIQRSKSRVTPEMREDGSIVFHVDIQQMITLGDQSGTANLFDTKNVSAILEEVKYVTEDEIYSAVEKSKELGADIFGFGESLNRKYPKRWRQIEDRWDELYQDIQIEINVEISAGGGGRSTRPLVPMED